MYRHAGVRLKPTKKPLIMSRLRKRMEELQLTKLIEYIPFLEDAKTQELEVFINALTTNETYFFRHTKQFNYFFEKLLPKIVEEKSNSQARQLRIWTAACSSGEEPYSIAIACHEFFKNRLGWHYAIFASDINSQVLQSAEKALYNERSLKEMPSSLKERYFTPVEPLEKNRPRLFKLNDDLVKKVTFRQHNLQNIFQEKNFDIIFLRNVMIYFDANIKQKVISNLENVLVPGGYLFISLSENINDVQSDFTSIAGGIYRKDNT